MTTTQPELADPRSRQDADRRPMGGEPIDAGSAPCTTRRTGSVIATVPFCTADEVDRAVQAAAAALPAWAETPVVERARVMFRFRERLAAHAEELAQPGHARARQDAGRGAGVGPARHRGRRVRLRRSQPDHGPVAGRTSPGRSTARRSATRSASARGSPRSTSRRWSRSGCSRSRSPAATRSS